MALVLLSACSSPPSSPQVRLDSADPAHPFVEVTGLSGSDRSRLSGANLTAEEWSRVLRVSVASQAAGGPPVAGRHTVGDTLRFVPMFPFDPGREYAVVFDPAGLSGRSLPAIPRTTATVSIPAPPKVASTVVTDIYPSGDVIPENLLRMYIQFSAPMGLQNALDYLSVVDGEGRELKGALLPLDTELWSQDRTRATILFDPGRVKREILPNREMGRPLRAGGAFTLVVKASWADAQGMPLKAPFTKRYRVAPPRERELRTSDWRVTPPNAGGRTPLVVSFPSALDRGLLQRALAIEHADAALEGRAGTAVEGSATIDQHETRWTFVPRDAWVSGDYTLKVLPELEDPSGNRIGRPFEVIAKDDAPDRTEPYRVAFTVR